MPATPDNPTQQDDPLTPEQLASEIRKFEGYLDRFAGDIERLEARRDRLKEDISEYELLVSNVDKLLADGSPPLETRTDLGCDVSVTARVPDTRRVFVAVGLGFNVQAELSEVAGLVGPRRCFLAAQLSDVERQLGDAQAAAGAFEDSLRLLRQEQAGVRAAASTAGVR
ncbi:hypothetical protein GPECTOR_37g190 [Gonium pectorale]|uniref:Uncharacterized protein n=1 Tax=Gonium pectorale TaxID=33097 RepID=A0A150GBH4_GONPE|nr:hypothetical protein GPECTOR_37g190 [Gonium pectorale]|eukprot:KXZ47184.1 hypothetical protein GPECTOR_37g190 [Gonium pectorale]